MDMQSGGNVRLVRNSVDIVNAAAAVIVTAEGSTQAPPEPRRKWTDWLRMFFCFGSQRNGRHINRAALVPEPMPHWTDAPTSDHPLPPGFPFVAPPSSPASLLQSDPTSSIQSPNSPSPTGTPSYFATGPYAYETQLVSPPTFSDSTEPSTAPFTPPPESVDVNHIQPNDHAMNHQVSFELTVEGVVRCLEKKSAISRDYATDSFHLAPTGSGNHNRESNQARAGVHDEMHHDLPEKMRRSLSLRQVREFNLNNIESTNPELRVGSDWWANEKVAEITAEPDPVSQPGSASL